MVPQVHRAQGASGREYPRSAPHERDAPDCRGSSAENGVEQAGAFQHFHHRKHLRSRGAVSGRNRRRGAGGGAGEEGAEQWDMMSQCLENKFLHNIA